MEKSLYQLRSRGVKKAGDTMRRKVVILCLGILVVVVISLILGRVTYNQGFENGQAFSGEKEGKNIVESVETDTSDNTVSINILGKEAIIIDKDRVYNDIYGDGFLFDRWELNEVDAILNAVKGNWQIDQYVGFIPAGIDNPDLFDIHDNIGEDVREQLYEEYDKKVERAKNNVPEISFSIKEYRAYDGTYQDTTNNCIFVSGNGGAYESQVRIILTASEELDRYPVFSEQTAFSGDFSVEYPVVYIKFFVPWEENEEGIRTYESATLVLSSDEKFFVLINGAFYSVKPIDDTAKYDEKENRVREENSYFFPEGIQAVTYKIQSNLPELESKEEIELKVIEIKKIEDGEIYELKVDYGKEIPTRYEDNWDRCVLGYFYIQEDKIYFINYDGKNIDNLKTEEDVIKSGGRVVCQEEGLEDSLTEDEKGWHEYITVSGDCREYHGYNTLVESGYYEQFFWERGKGLVAYASGWGAEADSINLAFID